MLRNIFFLEKYFHEYALMAQTDLILPQLEPAII